MGLLNIDDLKPGMQLAFDLAGANGRFLLPKGTVLTDKHLRVCKIWGVTQAHIESVSREETEAKTTAGIDPVLLSKSQTFVDAFFVNNDPAHPAVREMRRLCLLRTVETLAQGVEPPRFRQASEFPETPDQDTKPEKAPATPHELLRADVQFATFPDIYQRISQVLNDPRSSAHQTADAISKDPNLTIKLLKLVNSPFYGFPNAVDSVSRAVTLVGANELSMLALGVSVAQFFKGVPPAYLDMMSFWKHSVACGVFARILAGHILGLSEERFFLAGLIHDIGRLILVKALPQTATAIFRLSLSRPCPSHIAEKETLGFDHATIAGILLKQWKFPEALALSVRHHHAPGNSSNPLDAAIVHCADILAKALYVGRASLTPLPPLAEGAWELLGLSPSVLTPAARQAERMVNDIYHAFLGEDA